MLLIRNSRHRRWWVYSAALLLAAAPLEAQAGLSSGLQAVSLIAIKPATAGVTITGGSAQTLAGPLRAGAINDFAAPVELLTAWNLDPAQTAAITVVAYFDAPAQALVSGSGVLPSRSVLGRVVTGTPTSFTPFTGGAVIGGGNSAGSVGATLVLFSSRIDPASAVMSRTDNLELRLDLTGFPELSAGTYTGTLNIRTITQ
jgi:hypothetical protein